ncbi:hypothetical protein SAMN04489730_0947 [Amycolatopsis australiensis]|uniref:Uncharacterized protein n=2 Tax=Amycolatopsis australiensis TaxID=546364 RepID=A0A1K1PRZ2_9PSEU|nr:hypothetical protein SAMN04489730_0947 [Amycolatopsis australiensis]
MPFGPINTARITTVITELSREVAQVETGERFELVAALVEIIVWRALHGQTARQITDYLASQVAAGLRLEFVAWVVAESGRRLTDTTGPERGRSR